MFLCTFVMMALAQAAADFQISGYLENWVTPYQGYLSFNTVYYAFLCLDSRPNPDNPRKKQWDGKAIYETMTLAPVEKVMTETNPKWKNPYEWQRSKVQAAIDDCAAHGVKFIWSIGGWSDLTLTISDAQIPTLVEQVVNLLKLGGDGVDFDWEHLSTDSSPQVVQQQRAVLGKMFKALRKAMNDAGMSDKTMSYTTRWNCFWTSEDASKYGAKSFASDGECLDTFKHVNVSDVSWVNLMMYDAAPGSAFDGVQYFGPTQYEAVLNLAASHIGKEKVVLGFEPGNQAVGGIWEGFDIDFKVIDYMQRGNFGGAMFWAINERASQRNPNTPPSSVHKWQGNTGKNAQYIAKLAGGGGAARAPPHSVA